LKFNSFLFFSEHTFSSIPNKSHHILGNRRDTLGRRPRDRRISTGKRVTPQERDLIWFQKLHEHGPLSSSYLHAFTKHLRSSEKRARDRLTDLFNESNTPHKGAYLERPWQQFQTYDARYQELVYDLAPAGEKALKQAGLWHTYGHVATGPWVHKYMVACITASIELEHTGGSQPHLHSGFDHSGTRRHNAALRSPVHQSGDGLRTDR
jgi:hypothetical protein